MPTSVDDTMWIDISWRMHAAEVSRQVQGVDVTRGGWVGGDAWFCSVMGAAEVMKQLEVHSTLIIKNNKPLFPKEALHAVMSARHGKRPTGHWVTMTAAISGVKLIAFAFAVLLQFYLWKHGSKSDQARSKIRRRLGQHGFSRDVQTRHCSFLL